MFGQIFQEATSQSMAAVSMPILVAVIVILGLVGLGFLWKKGKTAEAISLLNTALIIIVILILLFPPHT
jgi:hypothetical protein